MKKSTSDIPDARRFKAHGQADYEVEGRIVFVRAEGPFNEELVPALSQTIAKLITPLAMAGNWAQVITFHKSAMCSPSALQQFGNSLKARYLNPKTNPVIALVMSRDVEGAGIMPAVIRKCYGEAGLECQAFTSREDALAWVQTRLQ